MYLCRITLVLTFMSFSLSRSPPWLSSLLSLFRLFCLSGPPTSDVFPMTMMGDVVVDVGRKEQSEGRDHQPKHFSSARLCACLFVACRNVAAENKISCSPPASRPEKSLPRRRHRRRGASEVNESTERQSSLRIGDTDWLRTVGQTTLSIA